ncbi:unnamed protein product, partial [Symbiodinium sp. CCMP2592]
CEFLQTDPIAKIVRNVVVAWVSAIVGLLPFLALMPLFEKLRGLELQSQHIIFWTFISMYFLFCMFTVCSFHAIVSYEDAFDWMISALWTAASSVIVSPIAIAVGVLLVLKATAVDLDEHLPFQPLDDHRYKVSLRKMAVSGRTLLKWLERDQSEIFARWEIAGHPETAAFSNGLQHGESSNGTISLDGVMEQHAILASVFVKSESHSVRLLGNAVLPGQSFIEHGFDGAIPLFRRGKKLEDAYVSVAIEQPSLTQIENLPRRGRGSIRMTVSGNNAMLAGKMSVDPKQECDLAGITFEEDEIDFMDEENFQRNCDLMGISFVAEYNEALDPAGDDKPRSAGVDEIGTTAFTVVPVADGPSQSAAAKEGMYGVGDPVLLQLHGKLLPGSVVDPGSGGSSIATVLVDGKFLPVALSQLMPAFEDFDEVQVLDRQQWKPGRILQEAPEGFHVQMEGGPLIIQRENVRRRFQEGSTILLYRNGWVEATVTKTFIEKNLLHRGDDSVQVRLASDDLSVPSWQVKAPSGVVVGY